MLLDEQGNRPTKEQFAYLTTGCDNIPTNLVNDIDRYNELITSMDDLGFSNEEVLSVWKIVASILHIGNMELDETVYDENKSMLSK